MNPSSKAAVALHSNATQLRYDLQMKTRLLAFLLLLPVCAEAGNAKIAAVVQTFEGRSLYSGSSFWPAIELPKDASPSLVCDSLLKSGFDRFTSYRITTAPDPNSSRLKSRKSTYFDSPVNNAGP